MAFFFLKIHVHNGNQWVCAQGHRWVLRDSVVLVFLLDLLTLKETLLALSFNIELYDTLIF